MRLLLLGLLIFSQAHADGLGKDQIYWAQQAYLIGEKYGEGRTLAAISGQESSYCKFKGTSWSRGCLGIKRSTARLFDPTVTRRILTDDNIRNLHDGLAYLLYCRQRTRNWKHMVYAYHYGLPKALHATQAEIESDGYVKAIIKRMDEIKEDTE